MLICILLICALVSFLGTMAGFGGGIFIVPILVMFFKVPIEMAIGVTAISLFPSSLLSTCLNIKKKAVDYKLMIALEIPTIVGAFLGAKLTGLIPTKPLEMIFASFLLFMAYKTLWPAKKETFFSKIVENLNNKGFLIKNEHYKVSLYSASIFGILAGVLAGLFGIGGGIIKTPIMINIFKVPIKTATATALAMIVFTSLSSGITHWQMGHIEKELLAYVVSGFFLGALIGAWTNSKFTDKHVKKLISFSIALAGMSVFVHAVFLA
ncbi:sulfite exporter TauE/SafE family protein [Bacteriovorax sp. BSW11_IV]|uniref:sulfite exporter TauE/SafE family protein n=1 Tax=Bacteriovorax sp. BSW11_IV TaxID=1353529 RepID=UPI000554DA35|nr:sulfite exporter TauE/SafE family protein [Bacteriovorax sp. BSW11_IV]